VAPVEVFVKCTTSGAQPEVTSAVKLAVNPFAVKDEAEKIKMMKSKRVNNFIK
jgi:hypothetical protein